MNITARVTHNRLGKLADLLERRVPEIRRQVASDVRDDWKAGIVTQGAVDTGEYLNSVQTEDEGPHSTVTYSDAAHAPFVEYGTYKMPARPAFWQTIAQHQADFGREVKREIEGLR